VKRRELMSLLGGAAAGWPLAAQAQHPAIPVVGYLNFGSPEASANLTTAFRKGLSEAGFVEGQNVAIEYRWARNDAERLPELATDLVRRRAAVIVTSGQRRSDACRQSGNCDDPDRVPSTFHRRCSPLPTR
jgi:ABC-type uncharacterized transport system substrate-binding protein